MLDSGRLDGRDQRCGKSLQIGQPVVANFAVARDILERRAAEVKLGDVGDARVAQPRIRGNPEWIVGAAITCAGVEAVEARLAPGLERSELCGYVGELGERRNTPRRIAENPRDGTFKLL